MSESFRLLVDVYLAGCVFTFLIGVFELLQGLFSFNSIQQQNLRLVLMKKNTLRGGRLEECEEPTDPSFKRRIKEFGLGIVMHLFNSLLSWIQILVCLFGYAKTVITWLFTPPPIRQVRWKLKNIPFQRAEDFLESSQAEGFVSHSEQLMSKTLEELSRKSERLTQIFATKVFGNNKLEVERYVSEARRLTTEEYDSVVIHPRFWAIPQNEFHARIAINSSWEEFSK